MSSFSEKFSNFFKSISLKIKLIFGAIIGVFGFITYFVVSKKINAKKILELELEKIEHEINIKNTEKDIEDNSEEIASLEKRAEKIKNEIKEIESGNKSENISREELDSFFDERGF